MQTMISSLKSVSQAGMKYLHCHVDVPSYFEFIRWVNVASELLYTVGARQYFIFQIEIYLLLRVNQSICPFVIARRNNV